MTRTTLEPATPSKLPHHAKGRTFAPGCLILLQHAKARTFAPECLSQRTLDPPILGFFSGIRFRTFRNRRRGGRFLQNA
ncbi:hypothetical protein AVEN_127790-1 [Araneus ventricosus]|uniref:Uncharacterized protein n=1 Tax=Araneus ventricosus TaxID=182803 RepID=A0A4Y2DND2_ARAVE|nr:hypothetical protein AVEN_127790-1 [Araneus ventricosus]